jgi:hypothetical protein
MDQFYKKLVKTFIYTPFPAAKARFSNPYLPLRREPSKDEGGGIRGGRGIAKPGYKILLDMLLRLIFSY